MATLNHWLNEAQKKHGAGDGAGAEALYKRVLSLNPDHAEARHLLGTLHVQQGRYETAVEELRRAASLDPARVEAANNLGIALKELGRFEEAAATYADLLARAPSYVEAHNNLGVTLAAHGRRAEARAAYEQALALRPGYAQAHNNLGLLCKDEGDWVEAGRWFAQAIAADPSFAEAHGNLGLAWHKQKRFDRATTCYAEAIRLRPEQPEAHNNLGVAHNEQHRCEEARRCFRQALALRPGYTDALANIGNSYLLENRLEEALAVYHEVVARDPGHSDAHWNRATTWLLRGHYPEGWAEYEWRFEADKVQKRFFVLPGRPDIPAWDGSDPAGKTILVRHEQGLGDTLHFVRYLPALKARGARVLFECQRALVPLLDGCAGADLLFGDLPADAAPPEPCDVQVYLLSLPHYLGLTPENAPVPVPYLRAAPERTALWRERLDGIRAAAGLPTSDLKVGLVWAGNPRHGNDANRSLALADLAPLAEVPGVTFYSLQKGPAAAQAADPPAGMRLVDLSGAIGDFVDTAAIIEDLDLVIAVDTSVVHLAGARGRPAWALLAFAPDWRWQTERSDTPWYPTVRLFRQARAGDWDSALAPAAAALRALTGVSQDDAETLLAEGESLFADGDAAGARARFERVLALEPGNIQALNNLGVLAYRAGDLAEAVSRFERVLALEPDHGPARENLEALRPAPAAPVAPESADQPRLSVLICTHNRVDLLRRVLEAYERQTLPASFFEVVVLDDASTDGTAGFLKGYRPGYRLVHHRFEQNRGLSAGRNQAVRLAQGDVVLFVDDDDAPTPGYLEAHLRTHEAHPEEHVGCFGMIEPAPDIAESVTFQVLTRFPGLYNHFGDLADGQRLDYRYFWGNVTSVKRSFLLRHPPFDEDTRWGLEDAELGWHLRESNLTLIHNKKALLQAVRGLTYPQFCERQRKIGRAAVWLTRKHADPLIPFWHGVANAQQRFPDVEKSWNDVRGIVTQLESLDRAGWRAVSALPDFLTRTLPTLGALCRVGAEYHFLAGYLERLREQHAEEERRPVTPATRPLVSVIMPCYNYARYLPDAVRSLVAQTYPHWELIVVNDGSPDDTSDVAARLIAEHPRHAIRLINQENSGHPSHPRNRGIRASGGEYLLCMDADDEIAPTFLAECVALLERNPGLSVAYTDQIRFHGDESAVFHAGDYLLAHFQDYLPFGICSLFRRRAWEDVGGWRAVGFEDWDFWLSCGEKGHFGRRIPKPLYRYRKHGEGKYEADVQAGIQHKARLILNHPHSHSADKRAWAEAVVVSARRPDPALEAQIAAAEALFAAGDRRAAGARLRRLAAQAPHSTRVLNDLGVLFWEEGDAEGALDYFRQALEWDPADATAARNVRDALRAMGTGDARAVRKAA